MATWKITPSAGVVNNNNGTFVLPEAKWWEIGDDDHEKYTVTYTDNNGCESSKDIFVDTKYIYGNFDNARFINPCKDCGANSNGAWITDGFYQTDVNNGTMSYENKLIVRLYLDGCIDGVTENMPIPFTYDFSDAVTNFMVGGDSAQGMGIDLGEKLKSSSNISFTNNNTIATVTNFYGTFVFGEKDGLNTNEISLVRYKWDVNDYQLFRDSLYPGSLTHGLSSGNLTHFEIGFNHVKIKVDDSVPYHDKIEYYFNKRPKYSDPSEIGGFSIYFSVSE